MQGFCDDLQIKAEQLFFALKHHDNSYKLSMKERIPKFRLIKEFTGHSCTKFRCYCTYNFLCDVISTSLSVEYNDAGENDLKKY
ncbi:unnamed protein product [Onchocerca flexuosa]|uniref:Uncharacterized protein n=1 Tax=Onchocerca flexuosa TaxID=387005 RepID=A0A183HBG1_9BILA|nr:unnamed protein product [Onchocerca flexuosa]